MIKKLFFLKSGGFRTTIILTIGTILFLSTVLAVLAWYIAPVLFPEVQTQLTRVNAPPLDYIKLIDADLNQKADFGSISVRVWTEPEKIETNKELELFLEILDSNGKPTSLDTSIHYTHIHTYATRSDLGGDTIHLHPTETESKSGKWRTLITFPSAGVWHLVNQIAKDKTAYQITSTFEVAGKPPQPFNPDFSRTKELDNWIVNLDISKEPPIVGEPVRFTFNLNPKPGADTPKLEGTILDNGHNLILSSLGDSFVWNQHGDGSVEKISKQVNLPVKRVPKKEHPFSHIVTFPKPGVWLLHFELQDKPAHFFVNVEE